MNKPEQRLKEYWDTHPEDRDMNQSLSTVEASAHLAGTRDAFLQQGLKIAAASVNQGLAELVEIKKRFGAVLVVDEAHAFGCVGPGGKGCAAEEGVLDEVDVTVATFSKALGGAGGLVAGKAALKSPETLTST